MNSPTKPVMKAHDPNDDPFASLCADYDESHVMTPPLEFGSGAIHKNSPETPEASASKKVSQDDPTDSTADDEDESSRHEDDDEPKVHHKEE